MVDPAEQKLLLLLLLLLLAANYAQANGCFFL
jgi:hypothetical protein